MCMGLAVPSIPPFFFSASAMCTCSLLFLVHIDSVLCMAVRTREGCAFAHRSRWECPLGRRAMGAEKPERPGCLCQMGLSPSRKVASSRLLGTTEEPWGHPAGQVGGTE